MSKAKERPILFSGQMVRAILDGRKTQTRRVVKGMAIDWLAPKMFTPDYVASVNNELSPYGYPSDRLWVREAYNPGLKPERSRADGYLGCVYRADDLSAVYSGGWTPSIHMPRRHSRIVLEILGVRVERLQAITEGDAKAEGISSFVSNSMSHLSNPRRMYVAFPEKNGGYPTVVEAFSELWDSINAKRGHSWASNPFVWVIEFRNLSGVGLHASQQPHAVDLASAPLRPNH